MGEGIMSPHFSSASEAILFRTDGVQSLIGGPPTKDCWASDSGKVALSLRDRKRDQQGGVELPSHLGSEQTPLGCSRFLSRSDRATTNWRLHPN